MEGTTPFFTKDSHSVKLQLRHNPHDTYKYLKWERDHFEKYQAVEEFKDKLQKEKGRALKWIIIFLTFWDLPKLVEEGSTSPHQVSQKYEGNMETLMVKEKKNESQQCENFKKKKRKLED